MDLEPAPGDLAELQLPWDFPRQQAAGVARARVALSLALPRVHGVDEAALLVAVFAIVLHRHSGQARIPLVVARGGRTYAALLPVAGMTCREVAEGDSSLGPTEGIFPGNEYGD